MRRGARPCADLRTSPRARALRCAAPRARRRRGAAYERFANYGERADLHELSQREFALLQRELMMLLRTAGADAQREAFEPIAERLVAARKEMPALGGAIERWSDEDGEPMFSLITDRARRNAVRGVNGFVGAPPLSAGRDALKRAAGAASLPGGDSSDDFSDDDDDEDDDGQLGRGAAGGLLGAAKRALLGASGGGSCGAAGATMPGGASAAASAAAGAAAAGAAAGAAGQASAAGCRAVASSGR